MHEDATKTRWTEGADTHRDLETIREASLEDLESVAGGASPKICESIAKGKVYPRVE